LIYSRPKFITEFDSVVDFEFSMPTFL